MGRSDAVQSHGCASVEAPGLIPFPHERTVPSLLVVCELGRARGHWPVTMNWKGPPLLHFSVPSRASPVGVDGVVDLGLMGCAPRHLRLPVVALPLSIHFLPLICTSLLAPSPPASFLDWCSTPAPLPLSHPGPCVPLVFPLAFFCKAIPCGDLPRRVEFGVEMPGWRPDPYDSLSSLHPPPWL